MVPGVFDVLK
jgi:hypothetical protein